MNQPSRFSTRYFSSCQEKAVAKALGGKQVANSGATRFNKGDVTIGADWLIECKTCVEDKKSFTIKKDWIEKNKEEAFAMNKPYSTLVFNFGPTSDNYYVIDEKMFLRLKEIIDNE